VHRETDPGPDHVADDAELVRLDVLLDRVEMSPDAIPRDGLGDPDPGAPPRSRAKLLDDGRNGANRDGDGVVADETVVLDHDVEPRTMSPCRAAIRRNGRDCHWNDPSSLTEMQVCAG